METVWFSFFVLMGTYQAVRFCSEKKPWQGCLGAMAILIAALLRPEGVMVFVIVFGSVLALWSDQASGSRRRILC